ncbi:MAG: macro domain-containing protein [Gemmatimonadota bacterium]|nr:macro domain-containing protein [Gemmatimonadota bacterium]
MEYKIEGTVISLVRGDITTLEVDAIVNPANSRLQLGGGVAGAIRRTGGESIQEECDRLGGTPVGTAVITGAGRLPAGHVIHAVGPRMGEHDEDRKLEGATLESLKLADTHGLESIALPAVSTGIFGYPVDRCARIMLETTVEYLKSGGHSLKKVIFCLFDSQTLAEFEKALAELRGKVGEGGQ